MRTGRKRKDNVIRDKSGKSRGEIPGIHPETLAVRNRQLQALGIPLKQMRREGDRWVEKDTASDGASGITLGLLYLRGKGRPKDPGSIDEPQYLAGQAFARVIYRYLSIRGMLKQVKSPSFIMVGGDGPNGRGEADMSPEAQEEFQRAYDKSGDDFKKCFNALAKAAREAGLGGHKVQTVTYAVCVDNIPVGSLSPADYGALRVGLNALGRVV